MIKNLEEHLSGIVLGVRFRPNFVIEDNLGEIADSILYRKKTKLGPEIFPATDLSGGQRILFNQETDDKLIIDRANIILEISFGEKGNFNRRDIEILLEIYKDYCLDGILKKYKIEEIMRIGYIKKHSFEEQEFIKSFISKAVGNKISDINEINLRFSKKIFSKDAIAKEEVDDYDNAIFDIKKLPKENRITTSLDYQSFYKPYLPDISYVNYKEFIERTNAFNNNKFLNWINDYISEE